MGFLLGGAMGNFVDRFLDGRVIDFLDVGLGGMRWPTFNLADSFIVLSLAVLLLINLRQLIEKKSVMLSYQEVADWQNQEIAYYLVGISAQAMLGESEVLFQVVHSHDLESEWDYLVACSLAKEIKTDIKDKQFIMPICAETLSDKKQLGKITRKLADLKVAFLFDMSEDFDFEAILQASQYLKDKDIELWGKSGMDRINRREMDIFMSLDVLVISSDDLASKHAKELLDIVKRMEVSLVFDHEKKSLRKSSLEHFGIRYVFGDAYQKYESVTALKKESS
ncbi:MAG TPA: signal peptidase II [Bacillota bacterium]|nr:signal peptidase II [Bacillota bacterium]